VAGLLLTAGLLGGAGYWGLPAAGRFLVVDDAPVASDAVVVLLTGVDYYPRLIQAAALYKQGFARHVIINGNRKTDVLRLLERRGYRPCCPWYADSVRILQLLGVSAGDIVRVSAEDAYDTISEARAVGRVVLQRRYASVLVTTSKFHTRRARHVWRAMYQGAFAVRAVAARTDPYAPTGWWRDGRQIRWVLSEYGAWFYYYWRVWSGHVPAVPGRGR
jgi:uncharacterized SAM-binding protein YcdF (DUF218 family)